jgi:hypothetical protein
VSTRATALLIAALFGALPVAAQEPASSPAPEPPKIEVTGFVDVYYTYNFNKFDPALRSFDVQHNAFSLSLAEIAFAKATSTDSRIGFRIDLDLGKTADLVAAYEPRSQRQGDLEARPAGLRERSGRQEAAARLRQVRDAPRRRGDRVAGQLELQPVDALRLRDSVLPRGCTGRAARERQGLAQKEGDVSWSGIAAYAKYQARPNWALVGRFEYLDDDHGGFMLIGQKARTLTLTSDHLLAGGLKMRLEYRGDFSDSPFFADDKGKLSKSQHALIVGLVCAFGGKI